ncbi:MAG TPA: ferritin-like domain-containing protein [Kofleriaceae bacterium]|nr:ferritin-like domain-containing protein [Kofleriaceae bacterium]
MSRSFRRVLAQRLIEIVALTGCSGPGSNCGKPVHDPHQVCVDPVGTIDAGTSGVDAGVDPSAACPTGDALDTAIIFAETTSRFFDIEAGPTRENGGQCCYTVQDLQDCTGRPFVVDHQAITAPVRAGNEGWADVLAPRLDHLSVMERADLAAAWMKDGLGEHASVASFGRFALELMAVGAPPELIAATHRAILDEIRHAQLCFGMATAYAGAAIAPGTFPFSGHVEISTDLATIAARAVREGCIGETLAALALDDRIATTDDPVVKGVLASLADDEARHAELAWRAVAWAVRAGGAPVRRAVAVAFGELPEASEVTDVIRPAAERLLARAGQPT